MSDAFDAYHEWLGIPPEEQPADHYRLLGITRFEAKLSVIEHAADRQMAHVRSLQSGKHSAESQKLLNEIASAKLCLLDPEKKKPYDAELRRKHAHQAKKTAVSERWRTAPPVAESAAPPAAPPERRPPVHETRVAEPPALVSRDTSDSHGHRYQGKKRSALGTGLLIGLLVAVCCALVAGGWVVFNGTSQVAGGSSDSGADDAASPSVEDTVADVTGSSGDATDMPTDEPEGTAETPVAEGTAGDDPADPSADHPAPDDTEAEPAPDEPAPDEPAPDEPEIEPAILEPRPGSGSVDVLAAIDPDRHAVAGQWAKVNGRLTASLAEDAARATVELPVRMPDAYEVKLAVTRKAGTGPLEMSLPVGKGERAVLYLDREGARAGLEGTLDPADDRFPSAEYPSPLLPADETKLILCRVRANQIRMTVDGEAVVDWQRQRQREDPSLPGELPSLDGSAAYLGASNAAFQFDVLQVTALDPSIIDLGPEPLQPPPPPIARWTFNDDLSDEIGDLDGTAVGAAEIRKGRLRLDGRSYVFTPPVGRELTERTLEIWLEFASTAPPPSSVMGISQEDRAYDAIAYTGPVEKQWGSLNRGSPLVQSLGGPAETTLPGESIHLAFVYDVDGSLTAYRNGLPYGHQPRTGKAADFEAGRAQVFFGRAGRNLLGDFVGYIDQAQLFDRALTAEQVAELAAQPPAAETKSLIAVPPDNACQMAMNRLREVYKQELSETDLKRRRMFAQRLIRTADQEKDPADRFAALETARDIFANAGDLEGACQVVAELADRYEIDVAEMQMEILPIAAAKAKGVPLVSIARRGDHLFAEAVKKDDFDTAEQLVRITQSAAKRTDQVAIVKRCVRNQVWLRKYKAAFEKFQAAQALLATNPDDPAANQTVGAYYCFVKRDWPRGLLLLAFGDDRQLRTLAEQELSGATTADQQLALGNGWWAAAEAADDHFADALRGRAAHWYRLAVPHLPGVDQSEALRHIQEAAMSENHGWLVLFRAASPTYWNASIDDQDAYAMPVDSARQEVTFLRMTRMDTGQFVIVPMNLQILKTGGPVSQTLLWRNALPRIGIASSRLPVDRGRPCIASGANKERAYGGWGFGEIWGDQQGCQTWQGRLATGVPFEIAVKSTPLTREEQTGLLR